MGKPLSLDVRERVVDAVHKGYAVPLVADMFHVARSEVYHLNTLAKSGDLAPHTRNCGRKSVITDKHKQLILEHFSKNPDSTLEDAITALKLPIGVSGLSRIVRKMGLRHKKKTLHASEQDRPDVQKKRAKWERRTIRKLRARGKRVAFLDECGINTNLTPMYGWAMGQERVPGDAPLNKPKGTTVIAAIKITGPIAIDMWEGGTTKDRFVTYVRDVLIPALNPGDTLVMDNLTAHHCTAAVTLLKAAHIKVEFLPPYSPEYNPFEMMWSKFKSILRAMKIRVKAFLYIAAEIVLTERITAKDCRGWFRHIGYCL